jgi:hypothetical protein
LGAWVLCVAGHRLIDTYSARDCRTLSASLAVYRQKAMEIAQHSFLFVILILARKNYKLNILQLCVVVILRMVTRTFRLNPEFDKVLNEEAEKHGLTVSALLNQMIRQYILITRFSERVPAITLSYNTFAPIIERVSDKDLVDVAEKTGSIVPEEAMLQRGEKLTFDSVNWFIDTVYGRYGNWFNPFTSRINGTERIHLMHQLNHKWSQYLGGYMRSMFTSILDMEPQVETRKNSVTINVKVPKTSPSDLLSKNSKK